MPDNRNVAERRTAGLTVVETLVALLLFTFTMTAAATMLNAAYQAQARTNTRNQATLLAASALERLRVSGAVPTTTQELDSGGIRYQLRYDYAPQPSGSPQDLSLTINWQVYGQPEQLRFSSRLRSRP